MDSAQTRVLVVDGHNLFRTRQRALLEEQGFAVADAGDGSAGICLAGAFAPDVIVLDTDMLSMSSVKATSILLETAPKPRS
jgi:chemotaxis response regulator CheB